MPENYELPQGTVLHGRYEIFEMIGSGGFGVTYRAFDQLLNRFVAVKEFFIEKWMDRMADGRKCRVAASDPDDLKKLEACRRNFLREAKIMTQLRNIPYLSRLQDSFSENNTEYIVMKLLSGESLMDYVKRKGRIPAGQLLPMIEQVLFALQQMHEKGYIHRDICPGNLIRTQDGDLYLIDFGAATACDAQSALWNEQVFEHQVFEAPEHLTFSEQGPWTDIYSICASIVYLLTEEGIEAPKERLQNDRIPALLMRSGLSAGQQNTLLRGLAIPCGQRLESARELRVALCGEITATVREWNAAYAARTDIGAKGMNQDNLTVDGSFCYEGEDFETAGQITCKADELHLAAVCDGVGDAHQGELASRAVVQALAHFIRQYRYSERLPERLLDELLDQMNEKVQSLGAKIGTTATTLSLLLWKGNHYWCANIGDSPIYLLRNRTLTRMSTPHTRAQARIESGKPVSPADLHTLMNYLGKERTAGSQMATIRHGHLQKGDMFLLCSDGVTNAVDETALRRCLLKGEKKALSSVWNILSRRKGRDNCSAVLVRFQAVSSGTAGKAT